MAVPIPSIFDIIGPALPFVVAILALLVAFKVAPPIARLLRQRAYDTTVAGEMRRLEVSVGRGMAGSADAAVALIRGLHPQRRLGASGWWPRGWPPFELRTVWRDGRLYWQIDGGRDVLRLIEVGLGSAHPGVEVRQVARGGSPAVWSAIARLRLPSSRPLGDPTVAGPAVLSRLATLLTSTSTPATEVRYRVVVRPIDPKVWQRALYPESAGRSITSYVVEDILHTIFDRPHREGPQQVALSPLERDAQQRKRTGRVGFEVGLVLEVVGTDQANAKAMLSSLTEFTTSLWDGQQGIKWELRKGAVPAPPRFQLGDWELAQLWYLPDAAFDSARLPRERPLAPSAPRVPSGPVLTIGETRDGPLQLPVASLARHMAIVGSTGSGKSTLLLNLALGVLDTPIGATVIDPHGDLPTTSCAASRAATPIASTSFGWPIGLIRAASTSSSGMASTRRSS